MQSGHTKAQRGTALVAQTTASLAGEEVCLLLQIEAAPAESRTLEKECETVVRHALLETEGDAGSRLDGTLKELNGLFKGLALSQAIRDIHAIAAIVDTSGVLHASHVGRAEAYIVRGGAASQITEYSRGQPASAFVHISSGGLELRDTVIFSTQRLLRTVTPVQLVQLAQRGDQLLDELIVELDAEREQAALCVLHVSAGRGGGEPAAKPAGKEPVLLRARGKRGGGKAVRAALSSLRSRVGAGFLTKGIEGVHGVTSMVVAGFRDPKKRKRTHLLLLASVLAAFVVVWAAVQVTTSTERSVSKTELKEKMEQIEEQLGTAENRRLAGDTESANLILDQAEVRAKEVMDNEEGLFRMEALDVFDRIRAKREEINSIFRISPTVVMTLTAKNPDIVAQGFVGKGDGEFLVYDRQDIYRVLLNSMEDPRRLDDEELILHGVEFPRYQTTVFQTTDNAIIELVNDVPTPMKTEDSAGWIKGGAIEAYLRYLYILSSENNQVYKYERLSNRYSAPAGYNVNGDLAGALDMAIDGNIYVIKEGGVVVKLLRGEVRPFVIRHAPEGVLANVAKVFKNPDGSLYFLDPVQARVIVVTDGGASGESTYLRQFVFEGEQIGELKDLYVDEDESQLFVMDEKRIYKVDLNR